MRRISIAPKTTTVLLCLSCGYAAADADPADEQRHEFLFLLDEGYVQEKGEWQVNFSIDSDIDAADTEFELELEYGISDRFQIEAELEADDSNGPEISELEVAYSFAADNRALTFGIGALPPAEGDSSWGYSLSTRTSVLLGGETFLHASVGYESLSETSERELGLALATTFDSGVTAVLEGTIAEERESNQSSTLGFVSLGAHVDVLDDSVLGLSVAFGLTDAAPDLRAILRFSVEW